VVSSIFIDILDSSESFKQIQPNSVDYHRLLEEAIAPFYQAPALLRERYRMNDDGSWQQFLLAEYERFAEEFWRNEETGERRVNLFLSLASMVVAGFAAVTSLNIVLLTEPLIIGVILSIAAFVFCAMQILGILTMRRIQKRNLGTDRLKVRMDLVRKYFKDPKLKKKDYNPFHSSINELASELGKDRKLKAGGLLAMTAAMNIFISFTFPGLVIVGVAVLGFTLFEISWLVLFVFSLIIPFGVTADIVRSYILTRKTVGGWEFRVFGEKLDWSSNEEISKLLDESDTSKWTDYYILLDLDGVGLKIRQKASSQKVELKIRLAKRGKIGHWKKWSEYSVSKIIIEPLDIEEFRSTIIRTLSKGDFNIELANKILAITKENILSVTKTRKQARAVYDNKSGKWNIRFERTSADVVIFEKTEFEIHSVKGIKFQTAAVESKNLKLLDRFLRDHQFANGPYLLDYPAFLRKEHTKKRNNQEE